MFNLCSERLYDSSLFEGLVACFPFDDHNCPPLPLLKSFCDSAYDWLKQDMDHMVVVHCKAGKSRTGLMICCLLLYLKVSTHRLCHWEIWLTNGIGWERFVWVLALPLAKQAHPFGLQFCGVNRNSQESRLALIVYYLLLYLKVSAQASITGILVHS